ncbi:PHOSPHOPANTOTHENATE--CYSTEINE LIGASE 2 [Salix viminalis]|uniref:PHOSPHOPANTOTHENATE--CYSTEINE LIGASE 2 n=1 Tax=Salix viminalis TaxID=40686 RepID=A0A6N2MPW9_SALVM|nr:PHOSPHOPANTOTHENATE--CYSTEINE LIGASE 2 [Salix viminalis]
MLENPTPAASAPPPDSTAVKRYAPPNQRSRSMNRRKSGDRFDRGSSLYQIDGEKNQQQQSHANTRNNIPDHHGDAGSSSLLNDNYSSHTLIPLEGCCRSEASQLLNDRWAAIMHSYNDTSIDLSERPVMYPGSSAPAWGQFKLPHQILSPVNSVGAPNPQMDFLSELHRAIQNSKASYEN